MPTNSRLLLSCEHGGNRVPRTYAALFVGQRPLLATHRGYDIGALKAARYLRMRLQAPLVAATTTRLLVDLNRSLGHPALFSEFTRGLDPQCRERIIEQHYRPYREAVRAHVEAGVASAGRVIHVSVHSFTPWSKAAARRCQVGLLYDPQRAAEREFSTDWQRALQAARPGLIVRRNYPYRGVSDGLVTSLRTLFDPTRYVGIELEINQALAQAGGPPWQDLLKALVATMPLPGPDRAPSTVGR